VLRKAAIPVKISRKFLSSPDRRKRSYNEDRHSTMRKALVSALALTFALPALAAAAPRFDKSTIQKAAQRACPLAERILLGSTSTCGASNLQRRVLAGEIVEYTFDVRLGPGPYDVIGVHRVVRETAPFQPARTNDSLFLLHGDIWGFRAAFLADPARNLPVFLARNGVDVWGIDQRWVRVPVKETDFEFLEDWGFKHDIRDLYASLGVARVARALTGNGFGRMHLLGWSRGGMIGYAYLNAESQLPPGLRNVDGFIPVDIYLKTDDEEFRQAACRRAAAQEAAYDAGQLQNASGTLVQTIATLAATNPSGASPVFPGLTNHQAALLTGEATFVIFPPDQQNVPFYHLTGGTFAPAPAPSGLPVPTGLLYSPEATWLALLQGAAPYQPTRQLLDSELVICDEEDVPFDDHLEEITNPILYVGAGGGFGEYGIYTTTLLGSTDVTTRVVDLTPSDQRLFDYGHADLFIGTEAGALVWRPILNWLRAH
jgi:pimeloyl-ACP methyl ester carboxylesterase